MSFTLEKGGNSSKFFIEQKANVTGRWDPFYYRPELVALENRVRKVTNRTLRAFVLKMAGGATPSTSEAETHYTDEADGIPFIRVQNLSTTGTLNLEDIKRITRVTHESLLRRSRLSGGELLVKITGVGRMAVASVIPDDFEANINQHIVAIRTRDKLTSETLAAYLNLDLAEGLASRRSTGGTRPALDYPALLSIPVIFDERIPKLMNAAVRLFQERSKQARALLATLDNVLLDELGIPRQPEPPNTLASRMFQRRLRGMTGSRWDPIANQDRRRRLEAAIQAANCPVVPLRKLIVVSKDLFSEMPDGEPYLGLENIDGTTGDFIPTKEKESVGTAAKFISGQILFPKLRPYLNKTYLAAFSGVCSTEFHVFSPIGVSADYLTAFLRSRAIVGITSMLMTGNTLPRLQMNDIERLLIPVPSSIKQKRICDRINEIRSQARVLREQARLDLEAAKGEIEALILGKEPAK